jgi:hypothetical protein
MRAVRFASLRLPLFAAALIALACQTERAPGRGGDRVSAGQSRPPRVRVDARKLAPSQADACARLARRLSTDAERGAFLAGMLLEDYEAFRRVAVERRFAVTFRDSNPACLPHLAAGVQSKGHEILQKTWDPSNLNPPDAHLAGLVSDRLQKPPKGEKEAHPRLTLKDGEAVTCDYDLMDELDASGRRIPGESARDLEIRASLNAALEDTPRGHRDRVMHGAQSAYAQYAAGHPEERFAWGLLRPEAPLTAFDSDGSAYRLETLEDALDFYRCKGAGMPSEWDVQVEGSDRAR